jgi:hypothetical protein
MTKESEEQMPPDREPRSAGHRKEPYPGRAQGSRFFSCLLIAAVFIIIDLAIILYFLWPDMVDKAGNLIQADKPVVEQQVPVNTAAGDSKSKE